MYQIQEMKVEPVMFSSDKVKIDKNDFKRLKDSALKAYTQHNLHATVLHQLEELKEEKQYYKYELIRKEKEAKKKQKTIETKEVRLSPNIDVNDLNTKSNAARKFLEKGNKVKVTLRFRGREMAHVESSKHILTDFAEKLSDIAVVEKAPKMEGRSMMMFLTEKR